MSTNTNIYNLDTYGDKKSFYGKAKVVEDLDEDIIYLKSYSTLVCKIEGGIFFKLWDGYSDTTMRHIRAFLKEFDIPLPGTKKWWNEMYCSGAEA